MPLYLYRCPSCSTKQEIFKPLSQLDRSEPCPSCPSLLERQICAPAVFADFTPYTCPITGNLISGRREHAENLARHGCRVLESGESAAVASAKRAADAAFDAELDSTVESLLHALPSADREQLYAGLDHGMQAEITSR